MNKKNKCKAPHPALGTELCDNNNDLSEYIDIGNKHHEVV